MTGWVDVLSSQSITKLVNDEPILDISLESEWSEFKLLLKTNTSTGGSHSKSASIYAYPEIFKIVS
jgi:hypothetical protein